MSRLAREAAWTSASPASLFLLSELLWIISHQWNVERDGDQAFVPAVAARALQQDVGPALESYLDAAEGRPLTVEDERRHLDQIVLALFKWRSRDDLNSERPPWEPRGI